MLKKIKISDIIIFITIFVIVIISFNSFFIIEKINYTNKIDSFFINKIGQIRGSIQRYSKLKIANDKKSLEVKKKIESYIVNIEHCKTEFFIDKENLKQFNKKFNILKYKWNILKREQNKQNIVNISEKLWSIADNINLFNEKISDKKRKELINNVYMLTIFSIFVLIFLIALTYYEIKHGLEKDKITDPLTKLYNRRYLQKIMKEFISLYIKYSQPFSGIFIDIDNFKKINDRFGHEIGDKILKNVSNVIRSIIRKDDYAFRYGGEEIVILLNNTNKDEAIIIANRIKKIISKKVKTPDNKSVTISAGVAEYNNENIDEFLNKIDYLMYTAKKNGKNQVIFN